MANEKLLIELDCLIDNIDWDNDLQKWTLRGEPEDIPTVDAAEVVHGRWVMKETMIRSPFAKNYYCSECKEETKCTSNYCPNCGAKMDGERKDHG